ncbi:MAG TPA: cob(I)yrinic acid a,c-diamide adenosyltransferase [Alphaproteobacteria bacterium]|jgi:cob(I)alamin adenosyltransferase|nr:cob(I)yrinic acid a,c-diamide adenosyltransferase [Alphaproteobacteria bacterium]HAM48537.1 cob(I)yrinic acid a,c-diamide adenosyltransferase [Alphaproteobacteria bacterium]HBA42150.1 cob(I)yrinic acid a,c-diamide adenosyltransferase [Alphaproteobacteria bacterium]HBC54728.1 cob(I)yrinic acid a,c-diamide adenosyltransferase [Alphaproteobacteria bacterium]HBF98565.1 cob(I)yrinic acid a,c-diamide adenosyltransferase [Alphaproteobacteria bacterium]
MVVLSKIYTRTGDQGSTALGSGARVAKFDLRVCAYGTVDETNAAIGIARLYTDGDADQALARIQNDLFDLGADLCRPSAEAQTDRADETGLRVTDAQVVRLEEEIDAMNADLTPLRSFVLPGGSPAAAHLHLARTVCRRAERLAVELATQENVGAAVLRYLNRLSDYLFVMSRKLNDNGAEDTLWQPGQHR